MSISRFQSMYTPSIGRAILWRYYNIKMVSKLVMGAKTGPFTLQYARHVRGIVLGTCGVGPCDAVFVREGQVHLIHTHDPCLRPPPVLLKNDQLLRRTEGVEAGGIR